MSFLGFKVVMLSSIRMRLGLYRQKLVDKLMDALDAIEEEQEQQERCRSNLMVACHTQFYQERDAMAERHRVELQELQARHDAEFLAHQDKFHEDKKVIAVKFQGVFDDLRQKKMKLESIISEVTD